MATGTSLTTPNTQNAIVGTYHNATGSAIPANTLVKFSTTATNDVPTCVVIATTATEKNICGITKESIPAGGNGAVIVLGGALCIADGTINAGEYLMPGEVDGTVKTRTTGKPCIGRAEADAADTAQVRVLLNISDPS